MDRIHRTVTAQTMREACKALGHRTDTPCQSHAEELMLQMVERLSESPEQREWRLAREVSE